MNGAMARYLHSLHESGTELAIVLVLVKTFHFFLSNFYANWPKGYGEVSIT